MKEFMDKDFLLETPTARHLYHDYASKMPEIQNMMETAKTPKVIYLNSLHRFGKKQGLEIYRRIKPVLLQNVAQA